MGAFLLLSAWQTCARARAEGRAEEADRRAEVSGRAADSAWGALADSTAAFKGRMARLAGERDSALADREEARARTRRAERRLLDVGETLAGAVPATDLALSAAFAALPPEARHLADTAKVRLEAEREGYAERDAAHTENARALTAQLAAQTRLTTVAEGERDAERRLRLETLSALEAEREARADAERARDLWRDASRGAIKLPFGLRLRCSYVGATAGIGLRGFDAVVGPSCQVG